MKKLFVLIFFSILSAAVTAAPPETTKAEVNHLFTYLKSSNCKFNRNGSWYSAEEAADHLRTKYDYLVKQDLITTTESFIERGASVSSMSGKPYQVQCGDSEPIESAKWFMVELSRFRKNESHSGFSK